MNLIRIGNFEYTTEPHITYTPCYEIKNKKAHPLQWWDELFYNILIFIDNDKNI